ncbi:hypothetical protein PDESU_06118 [Pontiella desulfatans]|uniref:Uncharacterized protein n=1 Tax=Pontiella desulfatans TaxID=2750659 RepID=A0A6C2UDM7_PONDE|nr:hypothetical protein [Pontiella desulfatans]VGO17521.1 hypothetical protein PDESU_06118 [Pontiella desulfatans]
MKRMDRKTFFRNGALVGIVGLCAVLVSREEKFECSDRCGKCPKFENGKCGLGLK